MDNGLRVDISISWKELGLIEKMSFRNVTEIHYGYDREHNRVAFESDIHGTGATYEISQILEFETSPETTERNCFIQNRKEVQNE